MIYGLANTTAVSFTPLVFDSDESGDAGTADIRVFDSSNNLLATQGVNVTGFMNPTTFIGIVSSFGEDIGRINVWATSVDDEFSGVDNIDVYTGVVPDPNPGPPTPPTDVSTAPEPSTLILATLSLLSLCMTRRRSRR